MTFCSQNRHATAALYFDFNFLFYLKKVGFEPTMGENPTDLQSTAFNHSAISSYFLKSNLKFLSSDFFLPTSVIRITIKIFYDCDKKFFFQLFQKPEHIRIRIFEMYGHRDFF